MATSPRRSHLQGLARQRLACRRARARVLVLLPLFHIFALTSVLLRQLAEGNLCHLRMRFDAAQAVEDIERLRDHHLLRRADDVDRHRSTCRASNRRDFVLLAAGELRRRADALRGAAAAGALHRPAHRRRLGHDGNLPRRHPPAARRAAARGADRPAAAGRRAAHRRARRADARDAGGRGRRDRRSAAPTCSPATGSAPEENARRLRRWLVPDRRHGLDGRARLLHAGGPPQEHDPVRRLQRLSRADRAGDLRTPGRRRMHRHRRPRRLSRPGGEGLCGAEARRARLHAGRAARIPRRPRSDGTSCRRRWRSARPADAAPPASCWRAHCAQNEGAS